MECLSLRCFHSFSSMDNAGRVITGIDEKTRRLIVRYNELKEQSGKYETLIQELKQINEEQIRIIKELENKIEIKSIVGTIETKEGKVEAKARINELVREIDKCIGMLNK